MANTVIVQKFINNPSANNIGLAHFVHCVRNRCNKQL